MMNRLINTARSLAVILKNRRKEHGYTQADVARRSGLQAKTVSLLENNPERCSIETLMKHLSALDLELVVRDRPAIPDIGDGREW